MMNALLGPPAKLGQKRRLMWSRTDRKHRTLDKKGKKIQSKKAFLLLPDPQGRLSVWVSNGLLRDFFFLTAAGFHRISAADKKGKKSQSKKNVDLISFLALDTNYQMGTIYVS